MRLDEIMTAPAKTIPPTATVAEARERMQRERIRHLVVARGPRQVLGVVCAHDLRHASPGAAIGDTMSSPAVTLPPDAGVQEAAKLLRLRNVGSLPLVKAGKLVGIVTTSDLLALVGKGALRVQARTRKWTMPRRGPTHRPEPRRS